MKLKNSKRVCGSAQAAALLPAAVLTIGSAVSTQLAYATTADPSEIVVTARRTEEVIQNVPISMTVFNQEMLNERNVTNGADLVAFTPSLNVNQRFGPDQASFSIRGFTQDLATTASVAVYFADVVAPRAGGGQITGGDGAGPGAFFDLQNVQVLKGPQGTLFGRNTTGGAISLVPHEPTTKLEGYLELSGGNYDMRRVQGVLNVPISDSVRARFGLDTMKRDGYLKNITDIGPDRFANVDYWAGRASVIWDVSDSVQNYTIGMYTHSKNNGTLQKILGCADSGLFAYNCEQTQALPGAGGFYAVANGDYENPKAELKQWQIINTTTWTVSDDLTVKNILSYASLDQVMIGSLFASDFSYPGLGKFVTFPSFPAPGLDSNNQSTAVEELQFSGSGFDDKLTWQAGYYYENSRPNDWTGSTSPSTISCPNGLGSDPSAWQCADIVGSAISIGLGYPPGTITVGNVGYNTARQEFNNQAVYAQSTYEISDEWRATLGLRYTVDNTRADFNRVAYVNFPAFPPGGAPAFGYCNDGSIAAVGTSQAACKQHESQHSEAPTWLFDVDYLPTPDVMIYAKYSRGYRQGNIVAPAPPGFQAYDPEKVDAYEIGSKTTFYGPIPGTFNVSFFYNKLKDQQLQMGFVPNPGTPGTGTTAIVNAGQSTIQGAELETTLKLTEDLTFTLGYTYLDTHVDSIEEASLQGWGVTPSVEEGGHLTFSPRHTAVTGLSYRLPLPLEVGDVSLGATYSFTSAQLSTTGSPFAELDARQLLNLNAGWKGMYGSAFDTSFFVTNALNKKYINYVSGLYEHVGAEFGTVGEPRMWGVRAKYNF